MVGETKAEDRKLVGKLAVLKIIMRRSIARKRGTRLVLVRGEEGDATLGSKEEELRVVVAMRRTRMMTAKVKLLIPLLLLTELFIVKTRVRDR